MAQLEEPRAENLHELRRWTVRELQVAIDGSGSVVTGPRDLPMILERWLTDGVPAEPVEFGV